MAPPSRCTQQQIKLLLGCHCNPVAAWLATGRASCCWSVLKAPSQPLAAQCHARVLQQDRLRSTCAILSRQLRPHFSLKSWARCFWANCKQIVYPEFGTQTSKWRLGDYTGIRRLEKILAWSTECMPCIPGPEASCYPIDRQGFSCCINTSPQITSADAITTKLAVFGDVLSNAGKA